MLTTVDILETLVPMLAETGRPEILSTLVGTHVFDQKLDGVRAMGAWDGNGDFRLRNRNGRDLTPAYPDLDLAATSLRGPLILDGEIVAESGKFEDIAWRDKQKGKAEAVKRVPARFVAFDVLWHPDEGDMRHLPYARRRQVLNEMTLVGHFERSLCSPDPAFFERIKALGGEGVVAKSLTGRYAKGRSRDWLKVKSLHRITALATGYEPGEGARAVMGAIYLSVLDHTESGFVLKAIGKAGSGFSIPTATEMKEMVDKAAASGNIHDVPVVEIECLGATRSGVLRQPIYKGLRTDLDYTAATVEQLSTLPSS